MPYNMVTIDRADEDEPCCDTCAYKNECPAVRSHTECSLESGYPLWASSFLRSNWLPKKHRRKELLQ